MTKVQEKSVKKSKRKHKEKSTQQTQEKRSIFRILFMMLAIFVPIIFLAYGIYFLFFSTSPKKTEETPETVGVNRYGQEYDFTMYNRLRI